MSNKRKAELQARPVTTKLEQKLNTAIIMSFIATKQHSRYKQQQQMVLNINKMKHHRKSKITGPYV